jgi:hypothetical protein
MSVVDEVRRLATESPDTVYKNEMCLYTKGKCGNGEGCIIGQAIVAWCPEMKRYLEDMDAKSLKQNCPFSFYNLKHYGIDQFLTREEISWCRNVQASQDRGITWKEAVRIEDAYGFSL